MIIINKITENGFVLLYIPTAFNLVVSKNLVGDLKLLKLLLKWDLKLYQLYLLKYLKKCFPIHWIYHFYSWNRSEIISPFFIYINFNKTIFSLFLYFLK